MNSQSEISSVDAYDTSYEEDDVEPMLLLDSDQKEDVESSEEDQKKEVMGTPLPDGGNSVSSDPAVITQNPASRSLASPDNTEFLDAMSETSNDKQTDKWVAFGGNSVSSDPAVVTQNSASSSLASPYNMKSQALKNFSDVVSETSNDKQTDKWAAFPVTTSPNPWSLNYDSNNTAMAPTIAAIPTSIQGSPNEKVSLPRNVINGESDRGGMELPSYLNCTEKKVRRNWLYSTVISVIVALALIIASLSKVSSTQFGVEYNVWSKKLESVSKAGGLFLGPVGYRFVKFTSTQINADFSDTCVSNDGLRVVVDVSYQYRLDKGSIIEVILKYREFEKWNQVVNASANSAIQHSCSVWNVTDFQSNRALVQETMFENLQKKIEGDMNDDSSRGVYAIASSLQLTNVDLPVQYQEAVEQKQRASEDILLAKTQRIQEKTKADTEFKAAEKQYEILIDRAWNEGNITLIVADYYAQHTLYRFEKESEVLSQAQEFLSLSTNGVLSYMANKLFATVPLLTVRTGEPARISRKKQLNAQA